MVTMSIAIISHRVVWLLKGLNLEIDIVMEAAVNVVKTSVAMALI